MTSFLTGMMGMSWGVNQLSWVNHWGYVDTFKVAHMCHDQQLDYIYIPSWNVHMYFIICIYTQSLDWSLINTLSSGMR